MRPNCRTGTAGFTLIELLTVIVVLGIIAAFAAPSFREFSARSQLRGVANEAYTDIQYARSEAVQRNAAARVSFNAGGYTLQRFVASSSTWVDVKTVAFGGGTSVASGATMVATFDPVRATATVTNGPVRFGNAGTAGQIQLSVNALGRAQLCSPSGAISGVPAC